MHTLTKTFLLGVAVLAGISAAQSALAGTPTASGIDTLGSSQIFAVQGDKVGDWDKNQLSVTGAVVASGTVQVGQTTAACGSVNEGALRYNTTQKQMEICDGVTWGPLGNPKGSMCGFFVGYCQTSYANVPALNPIILNNSQAWDSICPLTLQTIGGGGLPYDLSAPLVEQDCQGAVTKPLADYAGYLNGKILVSCPSGYTLQRISWTQYKNTVSHGGETTYYFYNGLSCVKD